ncbi:MAG: cytochrome o ubiquinol oxidase subunit III, partial [Bradyrhizobium sp.]
MSDTALTHGHGDPYRLHGGRPHEGPAPKRIVTGYGFWIFLLSDFV